MCNHHTHPLNTVEPVVNLDRLTHDDLNCLNAALEAQHRRMLSAYHTYKDSATSRRLLIRIRDSLKTVVAVEAAIMAACQGQPSEDVFKTLLEKAGNGFGEHKACD